MGSVWNIEDKHYFWINILTKFFQKQFMISKQWTRFEYQVDAYGGIAFFELDSLIPWLSVSSFKEE